jgi:hypothetical protein
MERHPAISTLPNAAPGIKNTHGNRFAFANARYFSVAARFRANQALVPISPARVLIPHQLTGND